MIPGDSEEAMVGYKMREGRRIVGFALNTYPDPEQAYVTFEKPRPSLLVQAAANRICLDYAERTGRISGAQDILTYGLLDVTRLVVPALTLHPSIPVEQVLAIASNHETITSHAKGARIPAERVDETLFDHPGKTFDVSADQTHIEIIDKSITPNEEEGCPMVHVTNGEITRIEPLFQRFSLWAGHLAVISYNDHRS